jgi:hypothetical protein
VIGFRSTSTSSSLRGRGSPRANRARRRISTKEPTSSEAMARRDDEPLATRLGDEDTECGSGPMSRRGRGHVSCRCAATGRMWRQFGANDGEALVVFAGFRDVGELGLGGREKCGWVVCVEVDGVDACLPPSRNRTSTGSRKTTSRLFVPWRATDARVWLCSIWSLRCALVRRSRMAEICSQGMEASNWKPERRRSPASLTPCGFSSTTSSDARSAASSPTTAAEPTSTL